ARRLPVCRVSDERLPVRPALPAGRGAGTAGGPHRERVAGHALPPRLQHHPDDRAGPARRGPAGGPGGCAGGAARGGAGRGLYPAGRGRDVGDLVPGPAGPGRGGRAVRCSLYFVELRVRDWPASVAWYRDVLGLELVLRVDADAFALFAAGPA